MKTLKKIFQKVLENISIIIIMALLGIGYNWISGIVDSPDEIKRMKEKMQRDSVMITIKFQMEKDAINKTIDSLRKDNKAFKQWADDDYLELKKIKDKLKLK